MNIPFFPEQASEYARDVDNILLVLTLLTIFFTGLVLGIMIFFAVKYRRGSHANRDNPSYGDLRFELAWSLGPLVLGLAVFLWSARPFTYVFRPPADATEIYVIGKRWMWHVQHTNGIRENNELHIPVGKAVKLTMISQDVIHGFFVPAFRVKRDVLPGRFNTCWFQPTKPGKYHLFCTEYCGTNHSEMGGWVYVMEPSDYQEWLNTGNSRETAQKESLETQGESLYNTLNCGNCHAAQNNVHGPSLYGIYGKNRQLTNGQIVKADDDYLRESIIRPDAKLVAGYATANGQSLMPAYTVGDQPGQLSEDQIVSLVAYMKSLGSNGTQAPTPAAPAGTSSPGNKPNSGQPATNQMQPSSPQAHRPDVPNDFAVKTTTALK